MAKTLVLLLAFGVLLSGCSQKGGDGKTDPQLEQSFDEFDLQATATTGVIRGIVVDDAIKPIPGALVALSGESKLETKTDGNGLFGFDDLPAQTYFLSITKAGYRPTQQSVDVVAGVADPPIAKVLLQADPSSIPYFEQTSYTGYIQCGFLLTRFVFDASYCDPQGATGLSANDDSSPWFAVTGEPTYFQSEMTWEAAQEFSKTLVTIQWACNEDDCGNDDYRLCNVWGTSPIICRVDMEGGGGMTDPTTGGQLGGGVGINESKLGSENQGFQTAMFAGCYNQCVPGTAVGAGMAIEQKFTIFTTLFYGYAPPADWSFVADGYVPLPPV